MACEHRTVVSLLHKVCRENGMGLALVGTSGDSLTYAEMRKRGQVLSAHLVQNVGVRPGQSVGLCLDRCVDHIVAILAVLNAGAIYVPIDPELPQQRLAYMIKDAQLQFVLAQRRCSLDLENILCHFSGTSPKLVLLDGLIDQLTRGLKVEAESELELLGVPEPQPEDVAYMMYTSGSTGEPKGVMVPHRALLALTVVLAEAWELGKPWPESRVLQFSSHCFDASISEIFPTLCSGSTLVLGSREELLPGHKLADFMRSQRVTLALMPPSVMATLNDFSASLPLLRTIIAGGEACSLALARKWSTPGRKFVNAYGPTECTVITTMHVFDPTGDNLSYCTVPLGEPLRGWQVHLLNNRLEPVQDGEVGEIYISGVGVSRGYYYKPGITSKYFIFHPTLEIYLYRSGDLGVRQGPKRLLEYVGRVDNQVKINGFRVELGAVEHALCEHPFVEYAAVKTVEVNQDRSNHMLVAYVVPKVQGAATTKLCSEFLKYFLHDRLPKYMVPVIYVRMDALPLTPNRGKVDRKALPHPSMLPNLSLSSPTKSGPDIEFETEDGLNIIMSKCCAIFEKVLNLGPCKVMIDSNYCHLGGSSLWVAKLVYEVQVVFDVELLSWQIYKHPTPQQLAFCIFQMQKSLAGPDRFRRVQEVGTEEILKEAYSLKKTLHPVGSSCKTSSKIALVTGATGFLGVFLLENLLSESPLEVIYCLIRGTSTSHAWERLQAARKKYGLQTESLTKSSVKLVVLAGDVEDSKLGLSEESYTQVSDHVDMIYHVAAKTNYIRPYAQMRQPNVEGTKNILHFAAAGHSLKSLHYVSTIGIYGCLSGFIDSTFQENFDIEQCLHLFAQGENGYTKSKWVAEIMVLDFKSRGFPVSIYRPGFIEAHSITGVANTKDVMCRYIKGCFQMGAYPNLPGKFWEPIPVNFAADAICYISLKEKPGQIYNLIPDREREMDNTAMFQCLAEDHQCILQELPVRHWLDALSSVPPSNALYPLTAYLSERIHENRYTPLEIPTAKFGFENTKRALQFSNIEVPGFDKSLLQKYVKFFE